MANLRIDTPQLIPMPKLDVSKAPADGGGFSRLLGEALKEADAVQKNAEHQARELAAGRGDALSAVTAISKADLSLKFVSALRNRALEAFNEIIRTPI